MARRRDPRRPRRPISAYSLWMNQNRKRASSQWHTKTAAEKQLWEAAAAARRRYVAILDILGYRPHDSQRITGSTAQSGFGGFRAIPATGAFGTHTGAGTSIFGGSSVLGSGFGSSSNPALGLSGTSVFGSSAPSTTQPTGFGTRAQQGAAPASLFGGSAFGGTHGAFRFDPPQDQQGFRFDAAGGTALGSPPSFGGGAIFGQSSLFGSYFSATPNPSPAGNVINSSPATFQPPQPTAPARASSTAASVGSSVADLSDFQ